MIDKKEDNKNDPNLYPSPQVLAEVRRICDERHVVSNIFATLAAVAFSPLRVLAVSQQLSVLPHQNLYGNHIQNEKALAQLNKQLTPRDKARYQLMVKSGLKQGQRIFQAPIYKSLREAWEGLLNQGKEGLFKGGRIRAFQLALGNSLKYKLTSYSIDKLDNQELDKTMVKGLIWSFVDVIMLPFMFVESRFILQNCKPTFKTYFSYQHFFKKLMFHKFKFFYGLTPVALLSPFHSFAFSLHDTRLYKESVFAFLLFSYPFSTAMRRLQCQSSDPGMIPTRYSGVWHCIRLILKEQGLRGLYRGAICQSIYMCILGYAKVSGSQSYEQLMNRNH